MEISRLGQWIQISANVGILAGLLLVGVQISQNTKAVEAQMHVDAHNNLMQFEMSMLGENPAEVWAKSIEAPTELSLSEQRVMDAYIYIQVARWRHSYFSGQRGYVDEDQWRRYTSGDVSYTLANPFGKAWWERFEADADDLVLPPEMANLVEQKLKELPDGTAEYFRRIQHTLEE